MPTNETPMGAPLHEYRYIHFLQGADFHVLEHMHVPTEHDRQARGLVLIHNDLRQPE